MSKISTKPAAVIDIGSHAVKMAIGQSDGSKIILLEEAWVPIAVGADTFEKGFVSNTTLAELVRILDGFKALAGSYQVQHIHVFATAGIREATNADIVSERIFSETSLQVKMIDAVEEAAIVYDGVARLAGDEVKDKKNPVLFLAMGGGSTQVIARRDGRILFSESHSTGTMKMSETIRLPQKAMQAVFERLALRLIASLAMAGSSAKIGTLVIINDDIRSATKALQLAAPQNGINRIAPEQYIKAVKRSAQWFADSDDRITATGYAAMLCGTAVIDATKAERVIIPDISLSTAYLSSVLLGKSNGSMVYTKTIVDAGKALCQKYKADIDHAERVAVYALSLYDDLNVLYHFQHQDRVFLEIAALLHTIGYYISPRDHHKHSAFIIANSELLGFSKKDMRVIAQIARYHTKSMPKDTHPDFMLLDTADRVRVTRLASFLRIADKLDTLSKPTVESVTAAFDGENSCAIRLKMKKQSYDLFDMVAAEALRGSDLFSAYFGVDVRVERMP